MCIIRPNQVSVTYRRHHRLHKLDKAARATPDYRNSIVIDDIQIVGVLKRILPQIVINFSHYKIDQMELLKIVAAYIYSGSSI